jgi:hypothetical protein
MRVVDPDSLGGIMHVDMFRAFALTGSVLAFAVFLLEIFHKHLRDLRAKHLAPESSPEAHGYRTQADALREDPELVPYGVTVRDGHMKYHDPADRVAAEAVISTSAWLLLSILVPEFSTGNTISLPSAFFLLLAPPVLAWLSQRKYSGFLRLDVDIHGQRIGLRSHRDEPLVWLRFDEIVSLRLESMHEPDDVQQLNFLGRWGSIGMVFLNTIPRPVAQRFLRSLTTLLDRPRTLAARQGTTNAASDGATTTPQEPTGLRVEPVSASTESAQKEVAVSREENTSQRGVP